ncbi:MAG: hypothetical protein AB7O26_19460 [Planctomycetaceae bacterium]
MAHQKASQLTVDRRRKDRRATSTRRQQPAAPPANLPSEERRTSSRRKVERRRQIDPTTCERDYSDEEIAFMKAMDDYKRKSGRQFPTWSEVLEVLRSLGYRQVAEPVEISGR